MLLMALLSRLLLAGNYSTTPHTCSAKHGRTLTVAQAGEHAGLGAQAGGNGVVGSQRCLSRRLGAGLLRGRAQQQLHGHCRLMELGVEDLHNKVWGGARWPAPSATAAPTLAACWEGCSCKGRGAKLTGAHSQARPPSRLGRQGYFSATRFKAQLLA